MKMETRMLATTSILAAAILGCQPAEDAPAWILGDALDRLSDAATGSTDGGMSHHTAKMGPEFSPLLNAHEKTA